MGHRNSISYMMNVRTRSDMLAKTYKCKSHSGSTARKRGSQATCDTPSNYVSLTNGSGIAFATAENSPDEAARLSPVHRSSRLRACDTYQATVRISTAATAGSVAWAQYMSMPAPNASISFCSSVCAALSSVCAKGVFFEFTPGLLWKRWTTTAQKNTNEHKYSIWHWQIGRSGVTYFAR